MNVGLHCGTYLNHTHCATYRACGDFMTFIGVRGQLANKLGKAKLTWKEWYESWNDKVPLIQVGIQHGRIVEQDMAEIRNFDLIEVCEPWFSTSAQIAGEAPVVVFTYENIPMVHKTTADMNAIQFCADRCRKWLVATPMAWHCWTQVMGVPENLVEVVPRAIDCDQFIPPEAPRNNERVRILLNGRLAWEKGGEDLIFAAKALASKRDDFEVCFIGISEDPTTRTYYLRLIENLGLQRIVTILPGRDYIDMPTLYQEVDIACVLSIPRAGWHEQWCLSFIEAQASGLPVIGTRSDGAEAQVAPEWLIPPNRHDLLAEMLGRLVGDAEMRRQVGEANRARVLDKFNAVTRAAELKELYAGCI